MNCHIIPKVYLKSWKREGSNLFLFAKDNIYNTGTPKGIELKNTSFAQTDEYILNAEDLFFSWELRSEYASLFAESSKLSLFYLGHQIISVDDFILAFPQLQKWEIFDEQGFRYSTRKYISDINSVWNNKVSKTIEKYFSDAVENKWHLFLDYVNNHVMVRRYMVKAEYRDILIEFMALQMCRVFKHVQNMTVDKSLDLVKRTILSTSLPLKFRKAINSHLDSKQYKHSYCLAQLYRYVRYINTQEIGLDNNIVSTIISKLAKMQACLLIASGEARFITSDCPCYYVTRKGRFLPEYSGTYMPISPSVCAVFVKSTSYLSKYLLIEANDATVKYINYMTAKNSISSVLFTESEIGGMIDKHADLSFWKDRFAEFGLGFI